MARKVVNRKALREEVEAAERAGISAPTEPKKKAAAPKRKSRAKEAPEKRVKLYWGVFNQALKRVATFEYADRKAADQRADTLSQGGKSPHFVQKVKEEITV